MIYEHCNIPRVFPVDLSTSVNAYNQMSPNKGVDNAHSINLGDHAEQILLDGDVRKSTVRDHINYPNRLSKLTIIIT